MNLGMVVNLVLLPSMLALPSPSPDHRQCRFDKGLVICETESTPPPKPRVTVTEQPGGPDSVVRIESTPLVWQRYYVPGMPIEPLPCERIIETTDQITVERAAQWIVIVTNTDTGDLVANYTYCEWPGEDPPAPPPPPPPPTTTVETDEATRALLTVDTHLNPPVDGIGGVSQLPTWMWCDDPGPVNVEASTSGSIARAQAVIDHLDWTITGPDGTINLTANTCGTEPAPDSNGTTAAATWTPNRTGDSLVTLTTTWTGTWQTQLYLPRHGWITAGPFNLDPITITSEPIAYHIVEIQTVGKPATN